MSYWPTFSVLTYFFFFFSVLADFFLCWLTSSIFAEFVIGIRGQAGSEILGEVTSPSRQNREDEGEVKTRLTYHLTESMTRTRLALRHCLGN